MNESRIIESIHNYIDMKDFIIRKGAISAHKDKLCLVALNMRDGILLVEARGKKIGTILVLMEPEELKVEQIQ